MSQSLKLGIVNGETRLSKFRIAPNQQLLIGKAKTNDIVIDNSHVSGQHAQLLMDGTGVLHIVDVGSTNGTYVNGQKITIGSPVQITDQDKIVLTKSQNIRLVFNPDDFKGGKGPKTNGGGREVFQDTDLISLFRNKSVITIGRAAECDLRINHPTISRLHATIEKRSNGKYVITDKGSMNGTFVNGHRVKGKAQVSEKDLIFIGRFKISFRGIAQDISKSLTISATNIEKTYPNGFVGLKKASFNIASSSLLAVMGPSGCGKSTLLKALCGDSPATSGEVKLFDLELKSNYDYLKTQIGYVPQDDIVHRQLTVQQSLYYAAKLRLPSAKDAQIEAKIKSVLQQLNIEFIKDNLVGKISGGQRKRVSIAVELLTDPMILFLDEPTSPLDPQTIEEFLGILRKLADNGTTVIMVTHKPDDLEFMDSVMFMSAGGHLVYDDSVHNYLSYFGVSKTREVYQELDQNSKKWIDKRNSQRGAESKRIVSTPPVKNVGSIDFMHQFFWLSRRYLSIKLNDKMNTAVMIGQAPIIAMLVCIIFVNITQAVPFLMAISAVWFGANNAAREIVSELPIYKRERMFNQGILPYIFSKLFVLGGFAALIIAFVFAFPVPNSF
ncbi:FHA domain-containing protein [Crocinitomicaceae bacterium]|nr:FHA domain-containing protein [Crocinitomicaceae bacterium]